MPSSFLPPNNLLPHTSVRLGRLVLNTTTPYLDFHDPFVGRPSDIEFIVNHQRNFEETRKLSKSSKLQSYLTNILSISFENRNEDVASLTAPRFSSHDLQNSGAWFKDACAQPEARKWLEDAIDNGQNMYLVVGLRTVEDARLATRATSTTLRGMRGDVPAPPLTGVIVSPGAGGTRDVGSHQSSTFDAPGEQIYSVQYRKVKHKWYSSRKLGNTFLEAGTRWKTYSDWRGLDEGDEEEEDILEVALTDGSDLEDSDEECFGEDGMNCPGEGATGPAVMKDVDQPTVIEESTDKRKRSQDGSDETSKRLKM